MVRFVKSVELVNPQLTLLNWTFLGIVISALSAQFYLSRGFAKKVQMSEYTNVAMWVTGASNQSLLRENVAARAAASGFCTAPELWDYRWDKEGSWTFTDHSCMPMCPTGTSALNCLTTSEVLKEQELPTRVFIATQLRDTLLPREGSGTDPVVNNFFIMSADDLGVGISYGYTVPEPGWFGLKDSESDIQGSSTDSIWTVFEDSNGERIDVKPPSPSIDLSVKDLLAMAGKPSLLDGRNDYSGENQLPGGVPGGPAARLSGLELRVVLSCYNPVGAYIEGLDLASGESACTLKARFVEKPWVSESQLEYMDQGLRSRQYHGIRIVIYTAGVFEFIDYHNIYLNVVSMLVVVELAKRVVLVFTLYCLGQLSTIYKRVIREEFDLLDQVSSMATRLMANSANFVWLEDVHGEGISARRMAERMERVLSKRDTIDKDEIDAIVHFCFGQVYTRAPAAKKFLRKAAEPLGFRHFSTGRESAQVLDVDHFSGSCAATDSISFDSIVELFDKERRVSNLERLFSPQVLWREIHGSKQHAENLQASERVDDVSETPISVELQKSMINQSMEELKKRSSDKVEMKDALQELHRRLENSERRLAESERKLQGFENDNGTLRSEVNAVVDRVAELWKDSCADSLLDEQEPEEPEPQDHSPEQVPEASASQRRWGQLVPASAFSFGSKLPPVPLKKDSGRGAIVDAVQVGRLESPPGPGATKCPDMEAIILSNVRARQADAEEALREATEAMRAHVHKEIQEQSEAMRFSQASTNHELRDLSVRVNAIEEFIAPYAQEAMSHRRLLGFERTKASIPEERKYERECSMDSAMGSPRSEVQSRMRSREDCVSFTALLANTVSSRASADAWEDGEATPEAQERSERHRRGARSFLDKYSRRGLPDVVGI